MPATDRTISASALGAWLIACAMLVGCTTPAPEQKTEPPPPSAPQGAQANPQLTIRVGSGTYRCEQNARVEIKADSRDPNRIDLGWKGRRYTLVRHNSHSGLPRYEDEASQLAWVVLPWKGLLLDGRSGQPLANECKLS